MLRVSRTIFNVDIRKMPNGIFLMGFQRDLSLGGILKGKALKWANISKAIQTPQEVSL